MSNRLVYLAGVSLIIPLGLATKFYSGPGQVWITNNLGGLFYVLFWVLLTLAFQPRYSTKFVCLTVLLLTVAIEFLQLWHPPILTSIRQTLLGRLLLGNTFSWLDFPYYVAGALMAYGLVKFVQRFEANDF